MARKRKSKPVTVRYADGSSELVKQGEFDKRKRRRKGHGRKHRTGYKAYLRSTHWRKLRRKALERDRHSCQRCGCTDGRLEVHHLTYERIGREHLEDLATLCQVCHAVVHQWDAREKRALAA